jgi:N6-adenosine-specific RNA methylase IME4
MMESRELDEEKWMAEQVRFARLASRQRRQASVLLVDAPWHFRTYSDKGRDRCPTYRTMTNAAIMGLSWTVKDIAAKDCVMFFWATAPLLPLALEVLAAWGFEYKTHLVWSKPRIGQGYWVRSQHEICLVATRGKPKAPLPKYRRRSVIEGWGVDKRHSSKPDAIHTMCEASWPDAEKVELFARVQRKGWHCYGNELGWEISGDGIHVIRAESETASVHAVGADNVSPESTASAGAELQQPGPVAEAFAAPAEGRDMGADTSRGHSQRAEGAYCRNGHPDEALLTYGEAITLPPDARDYYAKVTPIVRVH